MSDATEQPGSPPAWFRPGFFLAGVLAGFLTLAFAGSWAARQNSHPGSARLHPAISPEGNYYPTLDELSAVVRARCRPDQILVIVGGNSIFNGVGQPVDKIWTNELQRRLGDRYAVINLAMRGAQSMEGGGVVAEVLWPEFPRQIYITNTSPFSLPDPVGQKVYEYLFWEAYYRGKLQPFQPRELIVQDRLKHQMTPMGRVVLQGGAWLDAALRYRDLWNWVAFEHYFTVPSFYTPRLPGSTMARGRLRDDEPDYETMPFDSPHRFALGKTANEMAIVRAFSAQFYAPGGPEGWTPQGVSANALLAAARYTVPDSLKARTLVMISRNSPYYRRMLTPEEAVRDDLAYRDTVAVWREAGMVSAEYGRDFEPEDYGDRTHLAAQGGRKLAGIVAQEVEAMALKLGYQAQEAKP